jgi:cytochrome c peroxidase
MHDGSLPTLSSVVAHYAGNLVRRPSLSTHLDPKLRLTPRETADLIAFLATLSSEKKPTLPQRENGLSKQSSRKAP